MRFVYSIVRFVPDPAREEFVNIGAIVGSEDLGQWDVRQVENPRRARLLDERRSLPAAWEFLDWVGRVIDEFEHAQERLFEPQLQPTERWLRLLQAEHRNVVQLSTPRPLVAENLQEAVDLVFSELVVDPALRRFPFEKKHKALATVRRVYRARGLETNKTLFERTELSAGKHRERLDFAVVNAEVRQLVHTWSFDVPDQEELAEQVKAWGWTLSQLRETGGDLRLPEGRSVAVDPDVDVGVVYVPPSRESTALEEAESVTERVKVWMVPVSEEQEISGHVSAAVARV
jgi:hypothetical protein